MTNDTLSPEILDRAKACLLGLAIGDAVGTTLEFSRRDSYPPLTDMVGGGPFYLRAGEWTDDTSMALCIAEGLIQSRSFDARSILNRFVNWMEYGHNSVTGECFDIGTTTRQALQNYADRLEVCDGPSSPDSAGNGSIMRLAPAVLAALSDKGAAISLSVSQSRLTHAAPEVLDACRLMGGILYDLIHQSSVNLPPELSEKKIHEIANGSYLSKDRSQIRSSGYVVDTLEAALWAVSRTDNFRDAVLLAVNLGDDADTVGAVTGQIAGAKFGCASIPGEWLDKLAWREKIEEMAVSLARLELCFGRNPVVSLTHKPSIS